MKKLACLPLLLIALNVAAAHDEEAFTAAIEEFRGIPGVAPYFESAYGYAVWPKIVRGGFIVGGAKGEGRVYRNGVMTGTSRVVDMNIGFQAGGQAYKQIIFFEDQRAYDEFTAEQFQFSAQASAVAVTAGAQASAGTAGTQASTGAREMKAAATQTYQRGLQVFTMASGGFMVQAAIGGQKYNFKASE